MGLSFQPVLWAPKRIMVVALLFAACSSAPGGGSGATPGGTQASTSTASQVGTSAAPTEAASAPAATAAGSGSPDVDLAFTGAKAFNATGHGGHCGLIKDATGKVTSFGYEATEGDFPGLGLSFSLAQFAGNPYVDIKWVIDSTDAYARSMEGKVELSADGRGVTLDTDLNGMGPVGGPVPGPEHVKGTITCP